MTCTQSPLNPTVVGQGSQYAVVLIPAYQPDRALLEVLEELSDKAGVAVVVVDDGSGSAFRPIFDRAAALRNVTVLRHAVNLGKGSALKTGINFILCSGDTARGVITVDADGQHHVDDILKVCKRFEQNPKTLVMGVRSFGTGVPLRSRLGNQLTRGILRAVLGQDLTDTQTGLRAIPREILPSLLRVPASGYEFELEMLIAVKHMGIRIIQEPIRTIYEPGNPTSHFQPLFDSVRIYFVLLRFSLIAALTAALDNLLFLMLFSLTGSIARSQVGARLVAVLFNYSAVMKAAFHSDEPHAVLLPRYLALVFVNTLVSYAGIRFLTNSLPIGVFSAKVLTESLLFLVNFAIQRDFVFTRRNNSGAATDWDHYYKAVPPMAHLTRRYTQSVLTGVLKRFSNSKNRPETIVEIGGANSCFMDGILRDLHPAAYHVIDQNEYGLTLLDERVKGREDVILHKGDVLGLPTPGVEADFVFSVGLIEHFDKAGTTTAITTHLDLLRSGGIAIISFPTPTWLYSIARGICESLSLWKFPDERPLKREEVLEVMRGLGEVVFEKTLWPLILTQHMVVVRKS